jgi:hypothetical protein
MQINLKRGKAALRARSAGLSVAIFASASIVATFSFFVPNPALAACGGASHSAGVHTASASTGAHTATGIAASSSGASKGGGGGSLGCANGNSAAALRSLPTAASGRVVEAGAAHAARPATHAKAAPTRTTNASAHLHTVKPAHHA